MNFVHLCFQVSQNLMTMCWNIQESDLSNVLCVQNRTQSRQLLRRTWDCMLMTNLTNVKDVERHSLYEVYLNNTSELTRMNGLLRVTFAARLSEISLIWLAIRKHILEIDLMPVMYAGKHSTASMIWTPISVFIQGISLFHALNVQNHSGSDPLYGFTLKVYME